MENQSFKIECNVGWPALVADQSRILRKRGSLFVSNSAVDCLTINLFAFIAI